MINVFDIKFKNPLIIAASPASENISGVINCAKAGAGGIILKSMGSDLVIGTDPYCPRRVLFSEDTLFVQSSIKREIIDIERGVELIKNAKKKVDIPIIASISGKYSYLNDWINSCKIAHEAGADMLQIDTFYSTGVGSFFNDKIIQDIVAMAEKIRNVLDIPILIKINPNIHLHPFSEAMKNSIIGVSLLDSISVGIPPDIYSSNYSSFRGIRQNSKCIATGKILFPLSLLYTQSLYRSGVGPICAGGGIFNSDDAFKLLVSGANIVQIASCICTYGYGIITQILIDLKKTTNDFSNIEQHKTKFFSFIGNETQACMGRIIRNNNKCNKCDTHSCELTIMCDDTNNKCEGCGLCIDVCSENNAKFQIINDEFH